MDDQHRRRKLLTCVVIVDELLDSSSSSDDDDVTEMEWLTAVAMAARKFVKTLIFFKTLIIAYSITNGVESSGVSIKIIGAWRWLGSHWNVGDRVCLSFMCRGCPVHFKFKRVVRIEMGSMYNTRVK